MADQRHKRISLAQNFLVNKKLVSSLVQASHVGLGDTVYGIGPGKGIITAELAQRVRKVIAIEKDPVLVEQLRRRFADVGNVEIVEGDFLRYPLTEKEFKVFGNIPFNRTAEIMWKLLHGYPAPVAACLIMQREAAQKFCGFPRETEFSVLTKPWFKLQIVRTLKRRDFSPIPNVDCVMLQIRQRNSPLICNEDKALYRRFVQFGFRRWKKNLKLTFKPVFSYRQWKRLAKELGFEMDVRPSALPFEQWLRLFESFKRYVPEFKQGILLAIL